MPQVLILLAIGAGIYAGSKWLAGAFGRKPAAKPQSPAERAPSTPTHAADRGKLEFDPNENVYRPKA